MLLLICKRTGHLLFDAGLNLSLGLVLILGLGLRLNLWCHKLGGAIDNKAVLDETLDHPVVMSWAMNTVVNTARTKVVITMIAYTAMIVIILHRCIAVVAEDNP